RRGERPIRQRRDIAPLGLTLIALRGLRLRAFPSPVFRVAVHAPEKPANPVLHEVVPDDARLALLKSFPAADVEPVLGARHGNIEQPVIFLSLGSVRRSLAVLDAGELRKAGGRPNEMADLVWPLGARQRIEPHALQPR